MGEGEARPLSSQSLRTSGPESEGGPTGTRGRCPWPVAGTRKGSKKVALEPASGTRALRVSVFSGSRISPRPTKAWKQF